MAEELTKNDLTTLIDAMDAWISKDSGESLFDGVLSMMMIPKDAPENLKETVKRDNLQREQKRKQERKIREETAILLKAKLLKMRDSIEADNFLKTK